MRESAQGSEREGMIRMLLANAENREVAQEAKEMRRTQTELCPQLLGGPAGGNPSCR